MTVFKKLVLFLACVFFADLLSAQDDLLSLIDDKKNEGPKKVYATFKTVRIGNAQSIETVKKNHLDFRISHRFGNLYDSDLPQPLNSMGQTFLGFDNVTDIRFSFDYGITDKLTVGVGRSKMNKLLDGSLKWRFLEQTSNFSVPVSVAFFTSMAYTFANTNEQSMYAGVIKDFPTNESHRFNFFHQLIIASKINDWLSVELLPGYMYRNFIKQNLNTNNNSYDVNGFFTLGFGGRIKLTKRVAFIGDYFFNFAKFYQNNNSIFNPLSLGFEIETGGHVFSLVFSNASGLIENNFIPYTSSTWSKGQVKFGFCISRTFAL
jgi:hypothetical protein